MARIKAIYAEAETKTRETGVRRHVDHILSLSKGGLHHPSNLIAIPAGMNSNPRIGGGGHRVLRPDAILRPDLGRLPSADTGMQSQGWQDSIIAGSTRPSQGWGDGKVSTSTEVHGTMEGPAEMHQNITVTVEPSAYLQAAVARAEAASRIQLNGQLGTSMQGPGDNAVKSLQAPPTGSQK
ncbi:HNH endonuclease [Bradyrhizobium sp. CIR3A]|uniref:HNH endonuclease n=1 Tax=Bradyrhizobium sp. CIR3A TaxID=2663838 RepID=UPI00160590AF|nr:hypothetical protein [Bradyrhizobium sp. CIR3A]MBB4264366.1 hypothetical protein [Bradyrhizobium sp. CIR3A]